MRLGVICLPSYNLYQSVVLDLIEDIELLVCLGLKDKSYTSRQKDSKHYTCRLKKKLEISSMIILISGHQTRQSEDDQQYYNEWILELIKISEP